MTTPKYPASLPAPLRTTLEPLDQLAASDLEGGAVAHRRRTVVPSASAAATWRYLEDEYVGFVAWWRTDLLDGRRWFLLPVPSAGGVTWHTCRFDGRPRARLVGHACWEVEAKLEVRERALAPVKIRDAANVLLCHFDDYAGPTRVIDDSPNQAENQLYTTGTFREAVNAHIYPGIGPFGGSAWKHAYSDTTGFANRVVWFPRRTEYALGQVFTIEFFVKLLVNYSSNYIAVCGQAGEIAMYSQPDWWVIVNGGSHCGFMSKDLRGPVDDGHQPLNVAAYGEYSFAYGEVWNHVAVTCDGEFVRLFLNGQYKDQLYRDKQPLYPVDTGGCRPIPAYDITLFGKRDDGWGLPNQWFQTGDCMAELRIRRDCLYTGPFSPPTGRLPD